MLDGIEVWIVPSVLMFPGVVLQIEEFAEVVSVVDDEFVFLGAIHGREGRCAASGEEGSIQGIEILGSDAVTVMIR